MAHLYFLAVNVVTRFFFFFQAEDGIRDLTVTGVQTCALPIFDAAEAARRPAPAPARRLGRGGSALELEHAILPLTALAGHVLRRLEQGDEVDEPRREPAGHLAGPDPAPLPEDRRPHAHDGRGHP